MGALRKDVSFGLSKDKGMRVSSVAAVSCLMGEERWMAGGEIAIVFSSSFPVISLKVNKEVVLIPRIQCFKSFKSAYKGFL